VYFSLHLRASSKLSLASNVLILELFPVLGCPIASLSKEELQGHLAQAERLRQEVYDAAGLLRQDRGSCQVRIDM